MCIQVCQMSAIALIEAITIPSPVPQFSFEMNSLFCTACKISHRRIGHKKDKTYIRPWKAKASGSVVVLGRRGLEGKSLTLAVRSSSLWFVRFDLVQS